MPPRRPGSQPDLSQQSGNPTSYIHDNYQDLMQLANENPEMAAQQVVAAAQKMVGHGLSPQNFKKLQLHVMQAARRGAFGLQKFLSDYLLAGTSRDLKVIRPGMEDVAAIGTLISEDINRPPIEWTRELLFIESVAKQYGLRICRLSEGMLPGGGIEVVRQFLREQLEEAKLDPEYGPGNDATFIPIEEWPVESYEEIYEMAGDLADEFYIEEEGGGFFVAPAQEV